MKKQLFMAVLLTAAFSVCQQIQAKIHPGALWPDDKGIHINAHGGGVLRCGDTFYWFGEHKADTTSSAMVGVTCYSSVDLEHWTNRGVALQVSETPGNDLERGCILERPKVIYNKKTGKYVMWFHLELKGKGYAAARYGVAVADKPQGPYTFLRSGRVNPETWPVNLQHPDTAALTKALHQEPALKWWTPEWMKYVKEGLFTWRDYSGGQMARDQTVFVDDDGKAYHIYASEENLTLQIAELNDDYTAHTGRYVRIAEGGQNEAPALFKHDGTYWLITSGCTGWAPNKARMFKATNIFGPWEQVPTPCIGPGADKTFGGQSTYVLKIGDNFVFMADIWRPEHPSDARYIWLPIRFDHGTPVIEWTDEWDIASLLTR